MLYQAETNNLSTTSL